MMMMMMWFLFNWHHDECHNSNIERSCCTFSKLSVSLTWVEKSILPSVATKLPLKGIA